MDKNKCYLCEKLCYSESQTYEKCEYRRCKSFGLPENRMYEEACTRLAVKFGRKHGWRFEGWVGYFDPTKHNWYEGTGGWAQYDTCDVVAMDDLRADLMMDAPVHAYSEFMNEQVDEYHTAETEGRQPRYVNYRNWLLGARCDMERSTDEWKQRHAQEVEAAHRRAEEAKAALMEELQRNADDLLANSDGLY